MKTLFAWLYKRITNPIWQSVEIQRREAVKKIYNAYLKNSHNRNRTNYAIMGKHILIKNQEYELALKHKLAKWEWLRKLS
jgi:hypothetical protein